MHIIAGYEKRSNYSINAPKAKVGKPVPLLLTIYSLSCLSLEFPSSFQKKFSFPLFAYRIMDRYNRYDLKLGNECRGRILLEMRASSVITPITLG